MKHYPHIEYANKNLGDKVWGFNKYDGSNLRFEWSRKNSWCKFGTKKMMIDEKHEIFGKAIPMFLNKYGDSLDSIFRKHKDYRNAREFVVFAEYVGENSFAGFHDEKDIMDIILFDIDMYKKGILPPKQFMNDFGHLHIPELIYEGNLNQELIQNVKNNIYNLKEGLVCKGTRKTKSQDVVWMVKIKTLDWLNKIKNKFGDEALKLELNNETTI